MTDKARELLERALFALESTAYFDKQPLDGKPLAEEIRAYIAEPEVRPLSGEEIGLAFIETGFDAREERLLCFLRGVDFAEKHHGIGGGDE